MKNISELELEINDLINSPKIRSNIEKNRANWHKLISSIYVIGDAEQAFDAYLEMDEPRTFGEKYLILYGVLQALFIQQDAIKHLSEVLGLTYAADPKIKQIREIRNNISGHPTELKRGKDIAFIRISRISMKRHSFKYAISYPDAETEFKDIYVPELIEAQREIVKNVLSEVVKMLSKEKELDRSDEEYSTEF